MQNGFAALIVSIILSVILLTVAIALNQAGFLTRSAIAESEYKEKSLALAEACADRALLKLANDSAYSGGEAGIAVGTDTCDIGAISANIPSAGQTTINTNAVYPPTSATTESASTNLQIVVNSGDLSLVLWEEIP